MKFFSREAIYRWKWYNIMKDREEKYKLIAQIDTNSLYIYGEHVIYRKVCESS